MANNSNTNSIRYLACMYLNLDNKPLPEKIRNLLNTVLIKEDKKITFRSQLLDTTQSNGGSRKPSHSIKQGKEATVYNTLIFLALIDSTKTRELLENCFNREKIKCLEFKSSLNQLLQISTNNWPRLFCLGINEQSLDTLKSQLLDSSFDVFSNKLDSPFTATDNKNNQKTRAILSANFDENMPWPKYQQTCKDANELFQQNKINEAQQLLLNLQQETPIVLPQAAVLLNVIEQKIAEAKEAADYIKKLLN